MDGGGASAVGGGLARGGGLGGGGIMSLLWRARTASDQTTQEWLCCVIRPEGTTVRY